MAKKEVAGKKKVAQPKKSTAKFISLTVGATIPTQDYGNIQPKIEVQAATVEEALMFAMPHIESLYKHYASSKPGFLGRVEVMEKDVATEVGQQGSGSSSASSAPAPVASPVPSEPTPAPVPQKSEAVMKAEKAISLAVTEDATIAIQEQIEKSVKIAPEDKPKLYELVLLRRKELQSNF